MATTTWKNMPRPTKPTWLLTTTLTFAVTLLATGNVAGTGGTAAVGAAPRPSLDTSNVSLLSGKWGDDAADAVALAGGARNRPEHDPGSLYTVTRAIGARKLWKHTDPAGRELTGAGVTIALLDSGVSAVPGLDAPGKIMYGPDLSGAPVVGSTQDNFGHGTFMAGLLAAQGPAMAADGKPASAENARPDVQEGLAPGANLLSLKLAGADGSTSVAAVITGLAWVVAHQHDQGMNVRVVNLSFGASALQPYQLDPLAAAAEAAWKSGIVVVASVGNEGATSGGLLDPAMDPFVISVGASDPHARVAGWGKPAVAEFSSSGTADRHADLVAPGTSLVSLRVPGSTVDLANPQGQVAGDVSGRLFRGSGTSQAAAVVSGAVALLLQAHPELSPDQVKATLVTTAQLLPAASPLTAGAGQIDLEAALNADDRWASKKGQPAALDTPQAFPASTGLDGIELGGLVGSWDGARWNGARWNGARWNGARWNGARWNGARWNDGDWS